MFCNKLFSVGGSVREKERKMSNKDHVYIIQRSYCSTSKTVNTKAICGMCSKQDRE